ncbi:hypothetical protein GBO86_03640 [Pediococcus acidilactici]|nr:hypothetical protein GBO86_03640 [Pediococcus acidilactici]UWF33556.1 hypothetical protein NYR25_08210 [Pediococcus acidilactici]
MLSKEQFIDAICNRFWFYENISVDAPYENTPQVLPLYGPEHEYALLGMEFMPNGKITFPVKLGFIPPDYYRWNFEEKQQEIIIYHRDNDSVKKGKLVKNGFYATNVIKLTSSNDSQYRGMLINYPFYDAQTITTRTIGGSNMVFIPQGLFNSEVTTNLTRRGYNVSPVVHDESLFSFIKEVYKYLIEHPKLEDVVIARTEIKDMTINFPKKPGQILLSNNDSQPAFNYCAGGRAVVLELLIMLITANNNRLLNTDNQSSDTELVNHVLNNHFTARYELLA